VGPPIQLRFWGEQCVAYDRRSGDTHLLSALAGQALFCAREEINGFDALLGETARALGADADAEFAAVLRETLAELESKGLLSRSCCSPN
jgi:PqqD family protein of HPr-rel-A system